MRQSSSCRRSRPDPQVFTRASRCPLMFVGDTTENVLALLLSGTRRTAEIRPAARRRKLVHSLRRRSEKLWNNGQLYTLTQHYRLAIFHDVTTVIGHIIAGSACPTASQMDETIAIQNGGSARVLPDLVHHSASPSIDVVGAA